MTILASVKADLFAVVAMFQDPKDTRHYLRGVCIESGGVMAATDGKKLLALQDISALIDLGPVTVTVEPSRDTLKACKPGRTLCVMADGSLEVRDGESLVSRQVGAWSENRSYPDWRRIVRSVVDNFEAGNVAVNPTYLKPFLDAAKPLGCGGVRIDPGATSIRPARVALVHYPGCDVPVFGIIYGLAKSSEPFELPEWAK